MIQNLQKINRFIQWGVITWVVVGLLLTTQLAFASSPILTESSLTYPEQVLPGEPFTAELNIDNSGTEISTGISVTVDIPTGATYVSGSLSSKETETSQGSANYNADENTITWVGEVDVNQNVVIEFDLLVDDELANNTELRSEVIFIADGKEFIKQAIATVLREYFMYLPAIMNNYPYIPNAPILTITTNTKGDVYTIDWSETDGEEYILEVSDTEDFEEFEQLYKGEDTTYEVDSKDPSIQYYRFKAGNDVNGEMEYSRYSKILQVVVDGFYVDDNSVNDDACTKLHWETDSVKSVSLRKGEHFDAMTVVGDGSEDICPSHDMTYELIVVTEGETTSADDDITTVYTEVVSVDGSDCNVDPYIDEFYYARTSDTNVNIVWDVECAKTVELKAATLEYISVDADTSAEYILDGTTDVTFKLRITGENDELYEASITVDFSTNYFYADDLSIPVGDCTTLRWKMTDIKALRVSFGKGFDAMPQQGDSNGSEIATGVCPSRDTTYVATVKLSDDTEITYEATVKVTGVTDNDDCGNDPAVLEFKSDEYEIDSGDTVTLSWEVVCTSTVFIQQGSAGYTPATGNEDREFTLTKDTEFTLRVEHKDGSFSYSSIEVDVN